MGMTLMTIMMTMTIMKMMRATVENKADIRRLKCTPISLANKTSIKMSNSKMMVK